MPLFCMSQLFHDEKEHSNWLPERSRLLTDLRFSQMIVKRANENKNCERLMNANARGGRGGGRLWTDYERSAFCSSNRL